jgi:hypothetical protein
MVEAAISGDRNAQLNQAAADFAVNGDVPLTRRWRLRAELGRSRWTFDGNELLPAPLPPEQIVLTRVTVAAIAQTDSVAGWYVGGGGGLYHYRAQLSPMPRPTRPGIHVLGGSEIALGGSGLALRLEGQVQAVGGPNDSKAGTVWRPTDPPTRRSRVFSAVLWNIAAGVGIGWRF